MFLQRCSPQYHLSDINPLFLAVSKQITASNFASLFYKGVDNDCTKEVHEKECGYDHKEHVEQDPVGVPRIKIRYVIQLSRANCLYHHFSPANCI